jgi:GTP-binding protein
MKVQSATFLTSAPDLASCPPPERPEFAFIGRSNVGKSSLLNMLTGGRGIAKVSSTPGHTRLINFFQLNDRWMLVDLPGYGYAKIARKDSAKFNEAVGNYISKRPNLACVFVLIDGRHSTQDIDLEFVHWLVGCSVPFVLVFTKSDKLKANQMTRNVEAFKARLVEWGEGMPEIFTTSAKTGAGRREVLEFISRV